MTMSTYLSPHFTLEEMTLSQIAERHGLDNTPPAEVLEHLRATASRMEGVRTLLGHPILVSSGYRSPEVNKAVGGVPTSAHVQGWAVDFICPAFGTTREICNAIRASGMAVDQVIQEHTWVHASWAPTMRQHFLTKAGDGYSTGLAA